MRMNDRKRNEGEGQEKKVTAVVVEKMKGSYATGLRNCRRGERRRKRNIWKRQR